ncbi:hypothetical protein MK079_04970 [Candidatus Gracilibacteria bacterium]|nr:hypothetical protein [Candidatus Gracilibacteria bacterium]
MNTINLVKIGSDAIVCKDNKHLKESIIEKIFMDIVMHEQKTGERFIVVSSGAIALGRALLGDDYTDAELFESGWNKLLEMYQDIIGNKKWIQGYLLQDNMNREMTQNLIHNFREDFAGNCLSIVNHDDRLSDSESGKIISKTDNDYNAYRINCMINENRSRTLLHIARVFFFTNTRGVLNQTGQTVTGFHSKNDIQTMQGVEMLRSYIYDTKSSQGTGGMESKIRYGGDCLMQGAKEIYIADAQDGLDCLSNTGIATKMSYDFEPSSLQNN